MDTKVLIEAIMKDFVDISKEINKMSTSLIDKDEISLYLFNCTKDLLNLGDAYKAGIVANEIPQGYEKIDAMIHVAEYLLTNNNMGKAKETLNYARLSYNEVAEEWQKAELLSIIAKLYVRLNDRIEAIAVWKEAISIARNGENDSDLQNSVDCSSVLSDISKELASIGELNWAKEVAGRIKSPGKRDRALTRLENSN